MPKIDRVPVPVRSALGVPSSSTFSSNPDTVSCYLTKVLRRTAICPNHHNNTGQNHRHRQYLPHADHALEQAELFVWLAEALHNDAEGTITNQNSPETLPMGRGLRINTFRMINSTTLRESFRTVARVARQDTVLIKYRLPFSRISSHDGDIGIAGSWE